jgi:hypothetical protein
MAIQSLLAQWLSFIPGFRLIDGGDLASMASSLFSTKTSLTALAGGGQAGATPLPATLNEVDTVVTNNDSVVLPLALPGQQIFVYNASAQTLAVYGQASNPSNGNAGDTIAAANSTAQQPTATGVTQATATLALYVCVTLGQWKQGLLI